MKYPSLSNKATGRNRMFAGILAAALSLSLIPTPFAQAESTSLELVTQENALAEFSTQTQFSSEDTNFAEDYVYDPEQSDFDLAMVDLYLAERSAETLSDSSNHWATPYLEKMVQYGYMRPEQAADPTTALTRADFMAIINRTYGYTEMGSMDFTDVSTADWFYDDVAIATNAGYISGTSPTTVEPTTAMTRQATAFILGKNLMLPDKFGEDLTFTDSRDVSDWARAMVKSASEYGLMVGYADGSFRPTSTITAGEIAALVLKAVGTPILEGGEVELYEVFGNVTITEPGTVLKNTIIAGDLHISNGIGLGGVTLENVTVLGRIVISGGESENGEASIILRNVICDELVVDNMDNQMVSVRVDGNSIIENTYVRTNAYLEDTTSAGEGMLNIVMDADPGIQLDLAGRIKEVNNVSPGTIIHVTSGTVDQLNIDETATETLTMINQGATVLELNIDVATNVTGGTSGEGDIKEANINASDVVIDMLPDDVNIRPGITADVNGETMDSLTAEENSTEPRILSGYPIAKDVAPTNFKAVFATNKSGTVYWAISPITLGSVSEENLLEPPSYGGNIIQSGSLDIATAEEEMIVEISELDIGGSYYLTAILVDARGTKSPMKVIAFETPDDSIPAFAEGYPYFSNVDNSSGQITAMTTKTCLIYWAVFEKGSIAPSEQDFIANALTGSVGSGLGLDMVKNKTSTFTVANNLFELTEYDLYLWLTDADNMNYSEVLYMTFTTTDGTPPVFNQAPTAVEIGVSDVKFSFNLNENGTVYWVAVPTGTVFPTLMAGDTSGESTEYWHDNAKMQVKQGIVSGGGAFVGNMAATANTTHDFSLTGLELETSYDLYYLAEDTAGNSTNVAKVTFNTVDNTAPTFIEQLFSLTANPDSDDEDILMQPYFNTDITLVFSEGMETRPYNGSMGYSFLELYELVETAKVYGSTDGSDLVNAQNLLAEAMANCFPFYTWSGNTPTLVEERNNYNVETIDDDDWVIDYRNVEITMENGQMYFKFPTNSDTSTSALNLSSGVTYGFKLQNLMDSSYEGNYMQSLPMTLDKFTTVYAQILLGTADVMVGNLPQSRDGNGEPITNSYAVIDADLRVTPDEMGNVDESVVFEMRMNPDSFVSYNMYMRVVDSKGNWSEELYGNPGVTEGLWQYYPETPNMRYITETGDEAADRIAKVEQNFVPDESGWIYLNMDDVEKTADGTVSTIQGNGQGMGVGLINSYWGYQENTMAYPFLYELGDEYQYEFVFEVTKFNSSDIRGEWNGFLSVAVQIYAGNYTTINSIGGHSQPSAATYNSLSLVSAPTGYTVDVTFTDSIPPIFNTGAPRVNTWDIGAELTVALNRDGECYYVVVPSNAPDNLGPAGIANYPLQGTETENLSPSNNPAVPDINTATGPDPWWTMTQYPSLSSPDASQILKQVASPGDDVISGTIATGINAVTVQLENLLPQQEYYVYFVTKSDSGGGYSDVYMARFTTTETERPIYSLMSFDANANVSFEAHVDSNLAYFMININELTGQQSDGAQSVTILGDLMKPFAEALSNSQTETITYVPIGQTDEITVTYQEYYKASDFYLNAPDMTILDAMEMVYMQTSSGLPVNPDWADYYSVFDVFGSASLKNNVHSMINTSRSTNVAFSQSTATGATDLVTVNRTDTNESPENEYVFLVSGYNIYSNSSEAANQIRSFSAMTGIRVSDTSYPKLQTSTATANTTMTVKDTIDAGTISLSFDKTIYAKANQNSSVNFITANAATGGNTPAPDEFIYANRVVALENIFTYSTGGNPDGEVTVDPSLGLQGTDGIGIPLTTLNFSYENLQKGATISLFNSYVIANYGGYSRGNASTEGAAVLVLTLQMDEVSSTEIDDATGDRVMTTDKEEISEYVYDLVKSIPTFTTTVYDVYWSSNWDDFDIVIPTGNQATYTANTWRTETERVDITPVPDATAVSAVSVEPTDENVSTIMIGETLELEAVTTGGDGTESVTWSNSTMKTVDTDSDKKTRTVQATSIGQQTITAKVDGVTGTYKINVVAPTVTLVDNKMDGVAPKVGEVGSVTVTISNIADISGLEGEWLSGNSSTLTLAPQADTPSFAQKITTTSFKADGENQWTATIYYKGVVSGSTSISFALDNLATASLSKVEISSTEAN